LLISFYEQNYKVKACQRKKEEVCVFSPHLRGAAAKKEKCPCMSNRNEMVQGKKDSCLEWMCTPEGEEHRRLTQLLKFEI